MTSQNSNPPVFSEDKKFNGDNFYAFRTLVLTAARARGVIGYLDGTIQKPTETPLPTTIPIESAGSTTDTTTPQTATEWYSKTPSPEEWEVRDAWALGLLIFNIMNPVALGVVTTKTAADAWTSLTQNYAITTDMAAIAADAELRGIKYEDSQDFDMHIKGLREKLDGALNAGAQISDASFRMIILSSLPKSWDPIVGTLYTATSSAALIAALKTHWLRIRSREPNVPTALQVKARTSNPHNQLLCMNPNCKRRGHAIENCYWQGGGKEGQFPPGFGQRGGGGGGGNAPMANTTMAAMNAGAEASYILAVITELPPDDLPAMRAFLTTPTQSRTYADSGATDHCFAN